MKSSWRESLEVYPKSHYWGQCKFISDLDGNTDCSSARGTKTKRKLKKIKKKKKREKSKPWTGIFHSTVQVRIWPARNQLCRKKPRNLGGQQAEREPATCPWGKQSQQYLGLLRKNTPSSSRVTISALCSAMVRPY